MTREQHHLARMSDLVGGHWTAPQIALIAEQVAPDANGSELELFLTVAKARGLDPFARQIHAVHRWDGRKKKNVMSIQTGIDGLRAIAQRSGEYVGNDDPVYLEGGPDQRYPLSATVTVWRLVQGQRCAFTATARWDEYCAKNREGDPTPMWRRMPRLMLAKCAEALALRKAFPEDLGGLYTDAEMDQAGEVVEAEFTRGAAPPAAQVDPYHADPLAALRREVLRLAQDSFAPDLVALVAPKIEAAPNEATLRKLAENIAAKAAEIDKQEAAQREAQRAEVERIDKAPADYVDQAAEGADAPGEPAMSFPIDKPAGGA